MAKFIKVFVNKEGEKNGDILINADHIITISSNKNSTTQSVITMTNGEKYIAEMAFEKFDIKGLNN
jgi:uncharacterized protein YlzI (FlbEa/FlbD family)